MLSFQRQAEAMGNKRSKIVEELAATAAAGDLPGTCHPRSQSSLYLVMVAGGSIVVLVRTYA